MNSIENTVKKFYNAMSKSDNEALDALFSEDVKVIGSSGIRYGKKEIMEYFSHYEMPYEDIESEIIGTYAVGNTFILESLMKAVHTGEYMGIPPSNKRIELPSVNVFEVVDGKITSWRTYQNNKILLDQHNR